MFKTIASNSTRAYTGIDATRNDPILSKNSRGFLAHGRRQDANKRVQLKENTKIRVASLNIGTLTGKTEELAMMLRRRRIDICTLQETRWSGTKSYDMEQERGPQGYKLIYNGAPRTRSGVGVAVSERLRDSVKEVSRYNDRLMKIIIVTSTQTVHIFSAYAPQTGRSDTEKNTFWDLLDSQIRNVNEDDYLIIAGDLNGHVGQNADGNPCHGGKGHGHRNKDGERIIDFCDSHDLTIANTWFIKRPTHLLTYYSGDTKSQIDFILVRRRHMPTVTDVKVIPFETVATQHRPIIAEVKISPPKETGEKRTGPTRIKWWRLHEKEQHLIQDIQLPILTTVEHTWNKVKRIIHKAAIKTLGTTKPGKRYIERDAWLWTDDVKTKVREKKRLYHAFLSDKAPVNWQKYCEAKQKAKRAVAVARASHYFQVTKKLDCRDGERSLLRLARRRNQQTQDIERFWCVNDRDGRLITQRPAVLERWRQHYKEICNDEFPHPPIPQAPKTLGPIMSVTTEEVVEAIKGMKNGKATGPDDIQSEIWKSSFWNPAPWLATLFNLIISEGKTPIDWQRSETVPIWKKKGNPADCSNYRPIRLLSHTLKIFERVVGRRVRDVVSITVNQAGFVRHCGTTDAIHAVRLLLEKYREKEIPVHIAFLDLEKAFDRVPHELIWFSLRQHGVPEHLVNLVRLLYHYPRSSVKSAAGMSQDFPISVGVHQGSALSPLLFTLVMDTITHDIQRPAPYTILYADDVFLASQEKDDLTDLVKTWHERLAKYGLRLNLGKTVYLATCTDHSGTICINGTALPRSDNFKYLGTVLSTDGGLRREVSSRVNAAWAKWRSLTGVMCDRKIKVRHKSQVYRSVIRPVALYGTECWPVTIEAERRLAVMETKMLRWSSGLTQLDRIRNVDIRNRYGVLAITEKMREARLRWYGHTLRSEDDSLAKIGMAIDISGKRPKGRPRQRWMDTLRKDLEAAGLRPDMALDRNKWRTLTLRADPITKWD